MEVLTTLSGTIEDCLSDMPCKYTEKWKALSKQIPGKNFIDCFEIGEEVK